MLKQCVTVCLLLYCINDYDELKACAAAFMYLLCIADAASYYKMVFGMVVLDTVENVVNRIKADPPTIMFVNNSRFMHSVERFVYVSWQDETQDADMVKTSLPLYNIRLDVVVLFHDEETRVAYKVLRRNMEDAYNPSFRTVWGLRSFGNYVTARAGRGRVPAQFSPLLFWVLAALLLDVPFRKWVSTRVCEYTRMTVIKKITSSSHNTLGYRVTESAPSQAT